MWTPMMAFLPLLTAMRLDPDRIAARLRIEESMDSSIRSDRGRRQLQPKEINIQVTAPLFSSRLFEFGKDADDTEVPQSLDVGKKVQLTNLLNYYGEDHNTLYILSNGAIGFEANSRSYKANLFPNGARLIAPFWNRNDLRNGGHVYYREVTKGRVLERGQSEIRYQYDKSVKVKSAVVVTWEKMQPLGAAALPEENTNTFQAALFITDNGTYANFIYSNVGWTQGAEAGFNRGDGSAHYALPTSGTGNIMYLEEYGNTGIPGEWMFELGKERVIRCKVGIKGDTCDEECSPGEWGADCALCCHCMEGTCQPLTGECNRECAECWMGNNCQIKKENCHARASAQCAPNAISFTDYDRCGEPLQRCQCLSGFSGDGYKSCHDIDECHEKICHERAICTNTPGRFFCQCQEGFSGDGVSECVASFLFPSDGHQPLPKSKAAKVAWQLKNPIEIFGTLQDKLIITSSGLISLSDITRTSGEHLEEMHMTGIAPFFAPIDTSKSGHVTVAEVTDTDTLNRLTRTISENYPDLLFQTKNALIVTHINVTDGKSQKGNTFQTLIVSGTNMKRDRLTFVELLYKDMTWGDGAEAGIITNDLSGSVTLPGSGTQGIEQLTQLSNIKQPGIWLFRIDEPTISPCPKSNQLPPYCEETHSTSTEGLTKSIQKLPSPSSQPHSASSPHPAILSENLDHRSEDLTIGVPVGEPKIIQPNIIPNFPNMQTSFATAAVEKTTFKSSRPRPRFESTSHRPIVSLVDKDFEEIDPDVFEITFPPFVTVIPEIFTPQRRKETTTSKALPDFTLTQQLQSTMRSSPTTTSELTFPTLNNDSLEETILNAPQTKYQHQLETTTELDKSTESMTTTFEHEEENDVEEETESTEVTAIPTSKTSYKEIHEELVVTPEVTSVVTTSNQPIFVFTTSKPIPKSIPKKPQIVTAPTTTTSSDVSEAETAASKMAIIIPSAIVMTWILLLIGIALFICCKRRSSRGHLHAGYGPTFTVQPTSYALKRGSKHLDSSYEDHLEKAARLSSEMTAYNQSGRLSLYGSYWNLNNSPNSDPSSSHRRSPLFSGYKPSRYSYTGRY